jgi:AraC-like DNA-binding protein
MPVPAPISAHGASTSLTGWETVGLSLAYPSKLDHTAPVERVVAALMRDRRDLARLQEALRPSIWAQQAGVLHAFDRLDTLEAALQRTHFDVLVIEPSDADGRTTEEAIRGIRERFPRLSVLGHVAMKPGVSSQVLSFARAGVHELIVAGIDDSATVLRHALQRASQRCLSDEVFAEVRGSLPREAASLVRYCLEHASESPSIEDISRALGVHRRTLVNRMQSALLPPPSELGAWARVLLAARYLEMPGRSVEWVAHTVGYPSANALRNALRKYTGMAPSELREDDGFARATLAFRAALLTSSRRIAPLMLRPGTASRDRHHGIGSGARSGSTHLARATGEKSTLRV